MSSAIKTSRPTTITTSHHGTISRKRQSDQDRKDVEPVGDRVEHLPEPRGLVPGPRQVAVQPVGEPAERENEHGQTIGLRAQNQPQHEGSAGQPQEAQHIGQGPHPIGVVQRNVLDAIDGSADNPVALVIGGVSGSCETRVPEIRRSLVTGPA